MKKGEGFFVGELLLYAFLTFFSAYGVFSLMFFLIDFIRERKYLRGKTLYTMVVVKNEACNVENIVKSLQFKVFKNDVGLCNHRIFVVDNASSDGTFYLAEKLFGKENDIKIIKMDKLSEKLEKI